MMILMALVTTGMTVPILNLVYPRRLFSRAEPGAAEAGIPGFSILIPVSLPKSGAPLVQLADTLIGHDRENSRLFAIHLRKPTDHEAYRSGLDEAAQTHDQALAPLLAQARGRSIPVKPVIGKQILGGTVHRVLQQCESDVAIFVDRGFRTARRILVPYLGSDHGRLALQLAARMAKHTDAQVTVLHVVPPMRGIGGKPTGAKEAVDRVFHEPGHDTPVTFRVIRDESPVGVVLHQAQNADLVIIGVAEEWGLESHLFGWRAQRIARDCPSSLLIVRKGGVASARTSAGPSAVGETSTDT
jgi:nucleotide-binding universal stress UspA family protein